MACLHQHLEWSCRRAISGQRRVHLATLCPPAQLTAEWPADGHQCRRHSSLHAAFTGDGSSIGPQQQHKAQPTVLSPASQPTGAPAHNGAPAQDAAPPPLPGLAETGSGPGWMGAVGGIGALVGITLLLGGGYMMKDQIRGFLEYFIQAVEDYGPWGYFAYAAVYITLEVLAVPAIPLTMTAGCIFGTVEGTLVTSLAGTIAATIAFLIAKYAVRDKVRAFAYKHPRFKAIDKAIGRNGLKFVTLLRLSPLLPLSASNYLFGLTSVDLGSYVLGSFIGMLPGTYAYVHAGNLGRAVLMEGEGAVAIDTWQIALGLTATVLALGFVGRLAKAAIDEVEQEGEPAPVTAAVSAGARAATTAAATTAAPAGVAAGVAPVVLTAESSSSSRVSSNESSRGVQ